MKKKSELVEVDEQIHPIAVQQDPYMPLIQMAVENDLDIEKFEKLMDLQDRHEAKNARKSFFIALSGFQSDLPVIEKKGGTSFEHKTGGGTTEWDFAKLEDIAKSIRPLLVKHGLSYSFDIEDSEVKLGIACVITHISGHEKRVSMKSYADNSGKKNGIQQISSAHSYMKRYTLIAGLGIVVGGEDNDGEVYQDSEPVSHHKDNSNCSDEYFKSAFPKWEKLILDKKKTSEEIIDRGNKQGVFFTEQQLSTIRKVGNV